VLRLAIDPRIVRLAALYAGTEPATPALSSWAAFILVRVAKNEGGAPKIATQFVALAKQSEGSSADPKSQAALTRARSLRAVEYFGQSLGEPDLQWLKTQEDTGFDLLALRPFWIYR
jgi:hypothetical protein